MNASKENARKALELLNYYWIDGLPYDPSSVDDNDNARSETVKFIVEFLKVAIGRLPSEAYLEKEKARKKEYAKQFRSTR